MSRIEKILVKFRRRPTPSDITFEEADKLLSYYGFNRRQPSGGSSHYIYTHSALENFELPIPRHGKSIKKVYVRKIVEAIDLVESYLFGGGDI